MTAKKIELTVTAEQARQIEQAQRRGESVRVQVGERSSVLRSETEMTGIGVEYVETPDGTRMWYRDGRLHRENGPAVEYADGSVSWYQSGRRHREDGPAIEHPGTYREWYRDGKRHREGGPALEYLTSMKGQRAPSQWYRAWYQNGQLHREDGPAVDAPGIQEWYQNGQLHREDGPAVVFPDGHREWFFRGVRRGPSDPVFAPRRENPRRPGPRSAAQTPAPPEDRRFGSRKNAPGTATVQGASEIQVSASTREALVRMMQEYADTYPDAPQPTLPQLMAVYRRGAGAFSVSHRPGKTRPQWALARVQTFLTMLRGGKVKASYRAADGDLLRLSRQDNPLVLRDYREYAQLVTDAYAARPVLERAAIPAWRLLAENVEEWFRRIQSRGTRFVFTDGDDYDRVGYTSAESMSERVRTEGVMYVDTRYSQHQVWTPEENWKFRAVHDYVVHIGGRHPFGLRGELASYNLHAKIAPKEALPALFSEVVGQVCYEITTGSFPNPQKVCILYGFDYYRVGVVFPDEYQTNFT